MFPISHSGPAIARTVARRLAGRQNALATRLTEVHRLASWNGYSAAMYVELIVRPCWVFSSQAELIPFATHCTFQLERMYEFLASPPLFQSPAANANSRARGRPLCWAAHAWRPTSAAATQRSAGHRSTPSSAPLSAGRPRPALPFASPLIASSLRSPSLRRRARSPSSRGPPASSPPRLWNDE